MDEEKILWEETLTDEAFKNDQRDNLMRMGTIILFVGAVSSLFFGHAVITVSTFTVMSWIIIAIIYLKVVKRAENKMKYQITNKRIIKIRENELMSFVTFDMLEKISKEKGIQVHKQKKNIRILSFKNTYFSEEIFKLNYIQDIDTAQKIIEKKINSLN